MGQILLSKAQRDLLDYLFGMPSLALVVTAFAAAVTTIAEWVIRTMDSSMAAIIGVAVIGVITVLIGAGRASTRTS